MKKLLPILSLLLLLSSCEFLENLFNETDNEDPTENIEIVLESICETLEREDGLSSLIYNIDPGITKRSDIESIKYTFTYSNGGAEGIDVNLETDSLFQRTEETIYSTRNTISRDIIVTPNELNSSDEGGNTPLGIAEIIIDMPGGGNVIRNQNIKVNFQNELESALAEVDIIDCCTSVSASLTNVIVNLKSGTQKDIRMPGCFRIFDIGKCCELD